MRSGIVGLVLALGLWGCTRGLGLNPGSQLDLKLSLPEGYGWNMQAPSSLELRQGEEQILQKWDTASLSAGVIEVKIPELAAGQELVLDGRFYLCQKTDTKICTQIRRQQRARVLKQPSKQIEAGIRQVIHWELVHE
ncbi:MAG: hypothetical protein ACK5QT_11340 [Oligoflexia bacterium]|jgi:hypothetical protein